MGPARRRGSPAVRVLGWAFVGLSLLFLALLLARQGAGLSGLRRDLAAFGWRLRPVWLAAALVTGAATLFLMAGVWVALFRALGGRCGAREGARVWMTTNLGRYIPGKIWQLSGLAVYMRDRRGAGAVALVAAAAFQLLVLGTGAAVAVATLGVRVLGPGALLPGGLLALLALGVTVRPRLVGRLAAVLARRMGEPPPEVVPGSAALWGAGAGLVVAWLANGAGLWLLWRGAGGPAAPGPWLLSGVFAAAYVAGYAVLFAPGGLVVREGALAGLLAAVAGVPLGVGAAVAVLARIWTTAAELLALLLAWAVPLGELPGTRSIVGGGADRPAGEGEEAE